LEIIETTREWIYTRRRKLATVGIGVLATLMGWHVVFGANGIFPYERKRSEYRNVQSEVENLQKENERLQSEIKSLRSDPKTIEREAREQLRYARPGEMVFTYPPQNTSQQPPANATAKKQ
jgi:cell division protein FtsB